MAETRRTPAASIVGPARGLLERAPAQVRGPVSGGLRDAESVVPEPSPEVVQHHSGGRAGPHHTLPAGHRTPVGDLVVLRPRRRVEPQRRRELPVLPLVYDRHRGSRRGVSPEHDAPAATPPASTPPVHRPECARTPPRRPTPAP